MSWPASVYCVGVQLRHINIKPTPTHAARLTQAQAYGWTKEYASTTCRVLACIRRDPASRDPASATQLAARHLFATAANQRATARGSTACSCSRPPFGGHSSIASIRPPCRMTQAQSTRWLISRRSWLTYAHKAHTTHTANTLQCAPICLRFLSARLTTVDVCVCVSVYLYL